ncbi:hypothetical protein ABN034_19330 [Actinopolymorpha sp. B11F2]|uniref:hypothetical protein n=1 Tax=Actinopolymorpha sp. B11F2 TaxID=3160862 RepID=UPI0032E39D19
MRAWLRWRLRLLVFGREGINRRARLRAQRIWCENNNVSIGQNEKDRMMLANYLSRKG